MIRHLSDTEVVHTRAKLVQLEEMVEDLRTREGIEDEEFRKVSLYSLMRLVNQLKEEIGWYEAHQREAARREESKIVVS